MYVRWETRRRTSDPDRYSLIARLSEAYRADGRPRQRTIAYLGSIPTVGLRQARWRARFRADAAARLRALGLAPEARARLEEAIARRVPEPTEDERAEDARRLRELERAVSRAR